MTPHTKSGRRHSFVLAFALLVACTTPGAAQTGQAIGRIDKGDEWADQGKYDKAVAEYSEAIRLDPDSARAFNNRGFARYKLGEHAEAVEDFGEALRLRPKYVQALNNRGNAHLALRRFDAAVTDFTAALEVNPLEAAALLGRGSAYRSLNQYRKAAADYSALIEQVENNRSTKGLLFLLNERAGLEMATGDYDAAVADLDRAIRLDPAYKYSHANRGKCWCEKGEYDRAVADLTEAIRLDPKYTWALIELGRTWMKRQQYDRAVEALTRAAQADPGSRRAFATRGLCRRDRGELDKALADFDEALRLDPGYTFARNIRAGVLFQKGEADKAVAEWKTVVAEYTREVETSPADEAAHNDLAWLLATCPAEQLRDGAGAVKLALRANELGRGKTANSLDTLAAAYAEVGEFDKAVASQKKALELKDPGYDHESGQRRLDQYRRRQAHRDPGPAVRPATPKK